MIPSVRSSAASAKLSFIFEQNSKWLHNILHTKYNLAPRGYGRTSFRLFEVIQMGRVPVYLYDDVSWVPYAGEHTCEQRRLLVLFGMFIGSNASIDAFGFVVDMSHGAINRLCHKLASITPEEYRQRIEVIKSVRHLYTFEGVIKQVERFFLNPFKDSLLKCNRVPDRDHRRLQVSQ